MLITDHAFKRCEQPRTCGILDQCHEFRLDLPGQPRCFRLESEHEVKPTHTHSCEDADHYEECKGCDEIVCEPCSGQWEIDGEYEEGIARTYVTARCKACYADKYPEEAK